MRAWYLSLLLALMLCMPGWSQDAPNPDEHGGLFPKVEWAVADFITHSTQASWVGLAGAFMELMSGGGEVSFHFSYPDVYVIDYEWVAGDGNKYVFKNAVLVQFVGNLTCDSWSAGSVEVKGGRITCPVYHGKTVVRKAISVIYVKNTEGKYRLFQVDMMATELINKYAKQACLETAFEENSADLGSAVTDK